MNVFRIGSDGMMAVLQRGVLEERATPDSLLRIKRLLRRRSDPPRRPPSQS